MIRLSATLVLGGWLTCVNHAGADLMFPQASSNADTDNSAANTHIFDPKALAGSGFEGFFFSGNHHLTHGPIASDEPALPGAGYTAGDLLDRQFFNSASFGKSNGHKDSTKPLFQTVFPPIMDHRSRTDASTTSMHIER